MVDGAAAITVAGKITTIDQSTATGAGSTDEVVVVQNDESRGDSQEDTAERRKKSGVRAND